MAAQEAREGEQRILADLLRLASPEQADAWAARLIARFLTMPRALAAATQGRDVELPEQAMRFLDAVYTALYEMLKARATAGPIFPNTGALAAYLRMGMSELPVEQARALFLDGKKALIAEEVITNGAHDRAPIYPREIVRRALELGASSLIIVHNHPSGDPSPSKEDIRATARLKDACRVVDLQLLDHVIVGREGFTSLYAEGLI